MPYRRDWNRALVSFVKGLSKPAFLMGDLNVAHNEIDLYTTAHFCLCDFVCMCVCVTDLDTHAATTQNVSRAVHASREKSETIFRYCSTAALLTGKLALLAMAIAVYVFGCA